MVEPTLILAFVAGILSFLSPCILPIIPGFIAFLSGTTSKEKPSRKDTFLNSLFFVLGFSIIFALMGVLLNTFLQGASYEIQTWLSRIGGVIIITFALHILGLIQIPFLMQEHKIDIKGKAGTYSTSFLFGASFAVGWSPCVGALLGSVLALAVTKPGIAFGLLTLYGLGLGLPFLIVGLFTNQAIKVLNKSKVFLKYFNYVVGILLIILGILVFTNNLTIVSNIFAPAGLII